MYYIPRGSEPRAGFQRHERLGTAVVDLRLRREYNNYI